MSKKNKRRHHPSLSEIFNCLQRDFRVVAQEVVVRRADPVDAHRVREQFNTEQKRFFADLAITEIADHYHGLERRRAIRASLGFQIHHIIPLGLSGTNEMENLALVNPRLHERIHRAIDKQTREMAGGDERKVLLPWLPELVWGLDGIAAPTTPNRIYPELVIGQAAWKLNQEARAAMLLCRSPHLPTSAFLPHGTTRNNPQQQLDLG